MLLARKLTQTSLLVMMGLCMMISTQGCKPPEATTTTSTTPSEHGTAPADSSGEMKKTTASTPSGTVKEIRISGSSTVEPVSQMMAELISEQGVIVKVAGGGTGAGFKQLSSGEIDIADASRKIKADEEEACKKNNIEFLSFHVGVDGITVVVNKDNNFCTCLSVEQLKKLWEPDSKVQKWNELDPSWPDQPIKLYGPDAVSGTFDYFCEEIVKTKKKEGESEATQARCRRDYQRSSDDNVLTQGVAGDKLALGYFGYAFYVSNKDKINAVGIAKAADKSNCVMPTDETIDNGTYSPLSRPLFIYVNKASLKRPEVQKFVTFYLEKSMKVVPETGYINVKPEILEANKKALSEAISAAK
jgi:phosphate transport system substrate-binding protein